MRYQITLAAAALTLSACASTTEMTAKLVRLAGEVERQGKLAAEHSLKDPESAIYRSASAYRLQNGDYVFCAEQNAKNGFGGFVGFGHVFVRFALGAEQPNRKLERRGFLAQSACEALGQGRPIPIQTAA